MVNDDLDNNLIEKAEFTDLTGLVMGTDDASDDGGEDGFEDSNLISLYDDEGNEFEFELLDYVDYEDKLYAVLIPSELLDDSDDQVVIMETYFDGNEPNFVFVDDEDLAQRVLDEYSNRGED